MLNLPGFATISRHISKAFLEREFRGSSPKWSGWQSTYCELCDNFLAGGRKGKWSANADQRPIKWNDRENRNELDHGEQQADAQQVGGSEISK